MAQAIPEGGTFVQLPLIEGLKCGQMRYPLLAVG
jgi:hypothetical protein